MKKVLIAYSTWAGATHDIADEIARIFRSKSYKVDVINANQNIDIEDFDVIVIGTSIHAGKTGRSFRNLIKNNLNVLNKKITAIFVVCANMIVDSKENRSETMTWLEQAIGKYKDFEPESIGLFGGATITSGDEFRKLNYFIKKIIRAMNKKMIEDYGKSDFRDWDSIRTWTEDLINNIKQD
jgi:menaquinone-dependent protoporphyrinogen oxidase